ncbi:Histone transcription regulator 3, partial [Coemansia spiralis]
MPVFTPINPPPPPASQDDAPGSTTGQAAPAARLEEDIRGLIRRYQAALRQWLRGQHQEACAAFNGLAESALLVRVQELHVESESSAYCKEHGGLSIARLRSLVLANAGVLRLTVEAGGLARHLLGSLGFDERTRLAADADDSEVVAVSEALTQLTAALAFDQANTAHRLAAGQCAMALGRHDVALSVLGEALGPAADADPRLPERRWGPLKWWCARAAVQAALMRGDAQLAAGLVQSTSSQSRSASEELQRLVDALVVLPASSSAPAVFRIPGAAAARRPPAVVPACVLTIQPTGDLVPLATFGEELVSYYRQCATGCPDAGTAAILGHVPLELCAVAAAPGGEMESADTGMQVGGDMSEAETDVRDHQPEPAAECQSYTDVDDAGSGIDCPAGGDVCRAPKRRASSSGDEMPAKRRSTRFSERSTSTAVAGTHGASSSGPALPPAGGRPAAAAAAAATRGGVRHALTVFPTAAVSAASNEASESAQVWLGAVDVASGQAAANSTSLCAALAEISCRQEHPGRRHKAQGRTPSGPDRDALADWNIDPRSRGGGSSKSSGTDALEAALQSIASPSANYHLSLAAHLGQQRSGPSDSALPGAGSPPPCHSLSIPECQALVGENSGVFDLLLRYIRAATEAFWESPLAFLQSTRLKLATLAVVRIAHGLLLDWAIRGCSADGSADDIRQGLRCGTLVIMLLADPLVGGTSHQQQQTSAMRTQWIVVAEDAVSRIMHQADDPCVAQYHMARAWSDYEAAVASNDTAQAATSVAACIDLLQRHADGSGGAPVARCSLSGMVVTLELARQRQAHLEFFGQLGKAAELARADERQAVTFLRSIAEPFADGAASALAFPQQVAATRLLAVLCGRQGMPEDAARATLYELHLYLSRLLAGPADAAMPVRLVVGRCAECLQAVHAMAATGSPVDQYLDSPAAQVPLRRVAGQLVPMAIALANHFEVGPAAVERATTSPEAKFVGLAAWLAARVTAGTPPASPLLPAGQLAAAPSECSDGAEALDGYMRFLSDIHALLGERGLCTAADGAFLKHVLAVCRRRLARDSDSPAHWDVAGSCLRCLFDIRLHSSSAEHHPSARVEMDQQLANAVYLLVETELLDTLRSRKGAGLRSDLKAVVDKAGSVLGSVDIAEHPRLRMNMDAIDDYLDGTTMPTFAQLELALRGDGSRALHVSCVPLRGTADDIGIPAACLSLPFVRATMQHQLLLFRMRSGLARAVEDYDEIIEDYKLNVSLNPGSAEAWHHLGQAHSDLADELLLGTASEILDSRYDIATLLRSALSCVLQAKQQLEPIGSPGARESKPCNSDGDGDGDGDSTGSSDSGEPPGQLHGRVYSLAGRLLYRIAARPLPMLALEILPSNILVADDSPDGRQAWDVGTWGPGGARAEALSQSLERRYCAPPPSRRVYAL